MFSPDPLVIIVKRKIDIPQQLFPYTYSLLILFGILMNGNSLRCKRSYKVDKHSTVFWLWTRTCVNVFLWSTNTQKLNLLLGQSHGQFWSYLELQRMLQLMKFLLDASCWQWFCFLLRQGLRLACSLSFSFPESPHCWDSNHGPPHLAFGNAPQTMFWSYTKAFTYLSEFALTIHSPVWVCT